jgi:hypothetical protein
MRKPGKKTSSVKKKTASKKTPKPAAVSAAGKHTPVNKQPQVKAQAAVAHGMFLYTDDAWSLRYFDQSDLHFLEREVFG